MATETKNELQDQGPVETPLMTPAPQVSLCFLLVSGRRKPMTFDSDLTTIGRVKELIWNAWDSEWDPNRPSTPTSLRLLYMGKMLQDEDTLRKLKFPSYTPQSPAAESAQPPVSIVHISVRPFDVLSPAETDVKKKKRRRGASSAAEGDRNEADTEGQATGCSCIIC